MRVAITLSVLLAAGGCASTPTLTDADRYEDEELHRLLNTPRPWLPSGPAEGSTDMAPFAACFDSENPPSPEVVAHVNQLIRGTLAKYNAVDRWSTTSVNGAVPVNTPITLRVSFVPDTVQAPDLGNVYGASTLFSSMDAKFGGNRALWISKFQAAFNRWSILTGVTYVWVSAPGQDWDDGAAWNTGGSSTRGDVRIAMRPLDGQSNVLAFNSYPDNGDMVLDSAENWQSSGNDYRFLRNVVMHEHGHGLGLAHVCPINTTKLLEPTYSGAYDGPQQDDLRGVQFRYGDAYEPNNSAAAATVVSSATPGQSFTVGIIPSPAIGNGSLCSITTAGDTDWYRFDMTAPALVSVTVTPLGTTYDSATQSGSSCPSGSPVNALTQADLTVAVMSSSGVIALGSASANPAGTAETAANVLVPGGAPFFVKVAYTGAPTQSQEYRFTVTTAAATTFTVSDGTYTDGVHLNWTAIPGVNTYTLWRGESADRASATLLTSADATSFIDDSAVPGQSYSYWLRAAQEGTPAADVAGPRTGSTSPCKADLGKQGGVAGFDGALDNNDFVVFINYYFGLDTRADFAGTGGVSPPDGLLNNNDFVGFIDAFFAGCR